MNTFIENLKVGDEVIISSRYGMSVHKVERITPAGNIKVGGFIFYKNGIERGGSDWERHFLREATPELINKIRKEQKIHKAITMMRKVTNITFEQAEQIIGILGGE